MKKIIIIVFVLGIFFSYTYAEETTKLDYKSQPEDAKQRTNVVIVGFPKGQAAGIQKELEYISTEHDFVDRGYAYLKEGKIKEAIEQFNAVLERGKKTAALGEAREALVSAYEKARDYKKAAELEEKIIARFKIPKGDMWRTAADERLLYLQYAANNDYDLAIEHAQKALEADAKLPNRPAGGRQDYIDRLNDLKAAKEYILSQKKN